MHWFEDHAHTSIEVYQRGGVLSEMHEVAMIPPPPILVNSEGIWMLVISLPSCAVNMFKLSDAAAVITTAFAASSVWVSAVNSLDGSLAGNAPTSLTSVNKVKLHRSDAGNQIRLFQSNVRGPGRAVADVFPRQILHKECWDRWSAGSEVRALPSISTWVSPGVSLPQPSLPLKMFWFLNARLEEKEHLSSVRPLSRKSSAFWAYHTSSFWSRQGVKSEQQ